MSGDAEAEPPGVGGMHAEIDRRAGDRQTVEGVHHARDFFDFVLHARRGFLEPLLVGRVEEDLNRIGRHLQIPDQVLKVAVKVPADHGKSPIEVMAHSSENFIGRVLAIGLEFDQIVAAIGFGDERTQLCAEPAGITLNVRVGADAFFHLIKNSRGFGQSGARRRLKIHHKPAFVETGQEVGFQLPVDEEPGDEDQRAGEQRQPGVPQGPANGRFVEPENPPEQETAFFSGRRMAVLQILTAANKPTRQRRCQRDGQNERNQQCDDHRQPKRAKEYACHSVQISERQKHDNGCQRGGDQRAENFADGLLNSLE